MEKRTGARGPMSDDQKRAIALGRIQNKAVDRYLDFLERSKPKRGRKRDSARIEEQLAAIEGQLDSVRGAQRVNLLQRKEDLLVELHNIGEVRDGSELEAQFIEHAAAYSGRKGISYETWLKAGVPAAVLIRAGLKGR